MKEKEVLIIIPAYNEAANIGKVLDQLEKPEISDIADILVMNDASVDATNWLVKARGHAIVTHVFNLGYGSGIQLGYKYAVRRGYKYVIQMDADGQHDAKYIPELIAQVEAGNNLVIGSRFLEKQGFQSTFIRRIGISLYSAIIKIFTKKIVKDTTSRI